MSTFETAYCNITTDLSRINDLQAFDRKRPITNWTVESSNVYKASSTGYISMLFENGAELGAAQANKAAVDSGTEWFWDSTLDEVYFYSTTNPNLDLMEAGEDWITLKQRAVDEAGERIRSFLNRPIYPRKGTGQQSASTRDYDWIIIHSNAVLAVSELIWDYDPEKALALEARIIDSEDENGLLDRLKRGEYALWNEVGLSKKGGIIRVIAEDATTTGGIIDVRGTPSVNWDVIKISIETGGTITLGSANTTVKYDTFTRDDTGIKTNQVIDAEVIDLGYQSVGRGMYVRFSAGIYVAADEWELEVSGLQEDNKSLKTAQMTR